MASTSDQTDDQALTAFYRDREQRDLPKAGKLGEELLKLLLGVPDQPHLDDHPIIADDAHPVLC